MSRFGAGAGVLAGVQAQLLQQRGPKHRGSDKSRVSGTQQSQAQGCPGQAVPHKVGWGGRLSPQCLLSSGRKKRERASSL